MLLRERREHRAQVTAPQRIIRRLIHVVTDGQRVQRVQVASSRRPQPLVPLEPAKPVRGDDVIHVPVMRELGLDRTLQQQIFDRAVMAPGLCEREQE